MDSFFPYTPRKTPYETLRDSFVGRESLLDELISSLETQADADTLQHWMILGTRGMGKSHIIAMVYHMVKKTEDLNSKWMPVLMNEEEQGVFSLHTLFVRILTKIGEELAESDEQESKKIGIFLDSLRDGKNGQDEILEEIKAYLEDLTVRHEKKLLVLLENADDLFTRCLPKTNDIKKLRNILQNDNFLLLFATSPTLFERITRSNAPLYQFFRLRTLDLLDYDQAVDLLGRWARLDGNDELLKSLKRDDYRLRVLYHLTGGNPRILMFLYMAIGGQGGIETAVDTFSKLLEEDLSSYYMSRMRDISNHVQPIVLALAESDHNLTQTEIAHRTFLPARSMGTSMARLVSDGIVRPVSGKRGKNTPYTLTDQLFRLWHQWRTGLREQKIIGALVEFLAVWYRKRELDKWAREESLAGLYSRKAIDFKKSEKYRGHWDPLRVEGKGLVKAHMKKGDYVSLFETLAFFQECGLNAEEFANDAFEDIDKQGDLEKAKKQLATKVKQAPDDFDAHLMLGQFMLRKGDYPEAEDVLKIAVKLDSKSSSAWANLGLARGCQKNNAGAEEAFMKIVELSPREAAGWIILGQAREHQKNQAGAEEAYAKALELDSKNLLAWTSLGFVRWLQENYTGAEDAYARVVELAPKSAGAWMNLGISRNRQENHAGAADAFAEVVDLAPKDAGSWMSLGHACWHQKNYVGSEEAFAKAVELDSENAKAWMNLGSAQGIQDNHAGAEEAYSKAVELDPENSEAWRTLAFTSYKNYKFAAAGDCLRKGIHINEMQAETYSLLCEFHLSGNVVIEPLDLLEKALSIKKATDDFRAFIHFLRAMVFLHNGDRTPFSKDLEAGSELLKGIDKEAKREVLGDLLDLLVDVTCQDTIEDIKAYSEGLGEISPDVGVVLKPLEYVLDYYTQYFAAEKKKGASVIRAQRVLDDIPGELRGPVEEMVQTVKKNILWSKKRPE
ncbi:MAG: tetratricopeptide repeat protein [Deltaproteobacteria bacterium]|nr:tetratricopeptide repeat protein [Deltaproteobacteria bacterium]